MIHEKLLYRKENIHKLRVFCGPYLVSELKLVLYSKKQIVLLSQKKNCVCFGFGFQETKEKPGDCYNNKRSFLTTVTSEHSFLM